MGQSLSTSLPIPSLNRVLYDDKYGTVTRYGLDPGQTFVDKTLGLQTLLAYLQDPTSVFSPVDMDDFFDRNTFVTPIGIANVMDEIYNTFSSEHINNIWFELLQDALSTNLKYKGIMKTSWIAIHCTRLLEVNGIFDE
jgi:hypothetical protein